MSPLHAARRTRRTWLPLVLGALLFAQMLGLVHRIAHAPSGPTVALVPHAHAAQVLFGAHDAGGDESTCRLYDQLLHADLAVDTPAVDVPVPATPVEAGRHCASRLAAQAAGFLARGPPSRG